MDIEQLVSRLTRIILTQLQDNSLPTVLIFASRNRDMPAGLTEQLASGIRLRYADEPSQPGQIDRYILPCLHIDQMVDMALGKGGSKMMYAVRQVLLSGKKVEVFQWEYQNYLNTAPRPLIELYETYRRTLHDYGLIDWIDKQQTPYRHCKAVLTEADILRARERGATELDIACSCRVTPLARETAGNLGIRLRTDTGGNK